jgi:hypothetical protein
MTRITVPPQGDFLLRRGKRPIAKRVDGKWVVLAPGLDLIENADSITLRWRKPRRGDLKRLLKGKSKSEVDKLMKGWGYPMSLAEAYHDAVRRGDDPEEIAWLKAQWLKAEKESMQ